MPIALLKAYAAMLPRLEAEEQLGRIHAGALAFGGGEKRDRERALAQLERQAKGPAARKNPKKANPADLAAMGIAIRTAPSTSAAIGQQETPSSSGCEAQPKAEPIGQTKNG
jgi:hypothetical protein